MHFFFEVSIPKNTTEKAPYEKRLPLSYGAITGIEIIIPAGHTGKAHLQLLYHEFQLYPLSRGENYHGDDAEIPFTDQFYLDAAPYELKAIGWNTDTQYPHVFLVGIEILRLEENSAQVNTQKLADLQEIIGYEIEG